MRLLIQLAILALGTASSLDCSTSFFSRAISDSSNNSNNDITLNYVNCVAENSTFADEWADGNATALPGGCAVGLQAPSSNSSQFHVAIYLPSSWNRRFMATGNGGYGGFTPWQTMGQLAQYGFAVVSTDTGHYSATMDGSWALNHPESVIDWSWRALHESVVIGKGLVTSYYGQAADYSYYAGCSTGGRQGLREVQDFPGEFDGVIVGAPAWWLDHMSVYDAWIGAQNLPSNASYHITKDQISALREEAIRQCDPQDGLTDNIVMDPRGCDFRPETMLCNSSDKSNSTCLSSDQIGTVQRLIHDWVDDNSTFVFPSYSLGADLSLMVGVEGDVPSAFGTDWIKYFLLNTTQDIDWTAVNYSMVELSDAINPGDSTNTNYDISEFQKRGGKLIHYHGYADQIIPTEESTYFYDHVNQVFASAQPDENNNTVNINDFYRFFYIPGMEHCHGSQNAPWYIAGPQQAKYMKNVEAGVPGFENRMHDGILALLAWTEHDEAPDYMIATKFVNDDVKQGVQMQRPLCPYPQKAQYVSGDVNSTTSWKCAS